MVETAKTRFTGTGDMLIARCVKPPQWCHSAWSQTVEMLSDTVMGAQSWFTVANGLFLESAWFHGHYPAVVVFVIRKSSALVGVDRAEFVLSLTSAEDGAIMQPKVVNTLEDFDIGL